MQGQAPENSVNPVNPIRRPLLGAHLSIAGGIHKAVARGEALGCEAIQIFTRNPRQWLVSDISFREIQNLHIARNESSCRIIVSHASYLINLAGGKDIKERSIDAMAKEIRRCHALGIDDVVLHPGFSSSDTQSSLGVLCASLADVLEKTEDTNVRILLETMAGQGSALGADIEHFSRILDILDDPPRVGVCADMCHVFGAGYDVTSDGGYARIVASLRKHVGLSRVGCWHISDSKASRGSRVDRHAHIGEGEIGIIPFSILVADERFAGVPVILETPKDGVGDAGNLALLRKLRGE